MTDARSSLAVKIMNANPDAYRALVVEGGTPALAREQLEGVEPEQLLAAPPTSLVAAYAMLAGLWLWHDALDESHRIAQKSPRELISSARYSHDKALNLYKNGQSVGSVESDNGNNEQQLRDAEASLAFWHAIMHRREGDFSNSKYWYARCRNHAIFPRLAAQANDLINPYPADKLALRIVSNGWNPDALVDLVEAVQDRAKDPRHALAVALQQLEWRALFDECVGRAG